MPPAVFSDAHLPALERSPARHNLILGLLERHAAGDLPDLRRWDLGLPGACAVQTPGYPIVLGDLDADHCGYLAKQLSSEDWTGIVGPDRTAHWLADRTINLGARFAEPIPQMIHHLKDRPNYPGASGEPRAVTPKEFGILRSWVMAFRAEATPHKPIPSPEQADALILGNDIQIWWDEEQPVSMAAVTRNGRQFGAIALVYTPPEFRARGYGGSVTAATAEWIFKQGKPVACLYTDLRNPISNRCYARVGFEPVCESWHFVREAPGTR